MMFFTRRPFRTSSETITTSGDSKKKSAEQGVPSSFRPYTDVPMERASTTKHHPMSRAVRRSAIWARFRVLADLASSVLKQSLRVHPLGFGAVTVYAKSGDGLPLTWHFTVNHVSSSGRWVAPLLVSSLAILLTSDPISFISILAEEFLALLAELKNTAFLAAVFPKTDENFTIFSA